MNAQTPSTPAEGPPPDVDLDLPERPSIWARSGRIRDAFGAAPDQARAVADHIEVRSAASREASLWRTLKELEVAMGPAAFIALVGGPSLATILDRWEMEARNRESDAMVDEILLRPSRADPAAGFTRGEAQAYLFVISQGPLDLGGA